MELLSNMWKGLTALWQVAPWASSICLIMLVLFLLHECVLTRFANNACRAKNAAPIVDATSVSVVVCMRNGAHHWPKLWEALQMQQLNHWELVVVDDGSTDETAALLDQAQKESKGVHWSRQICQNSRPGKKDALELGVRSAKGSNILVTDVDCVPSSPHWISKMIEPLEQGSDAVIGVSFPTIKTASGIWGRLQMLDALCVARSYVGWAKAGSPYMGVGRNMAYRKSLFQGFDGHRDLASGDDDLLIQSWLLSGPLRVQVVLDHDAQTHTSAPEEPAAWGRQKRRHWSTAVRYSALHSMGLLLPTILFFGWISSALLWIWAGIEAGVLHNVLWIVGAMAAGAWGIPVLNFRSFAEVCGVPKSRWNVGCLQPVLACWIWGQAWKGMLTTRSEEQWDL